MTKAVPECVGCQMYNAESNTCHALMFRRAREVQAFLREVGCRNPEEQRLKRYHRDTGR